MFIVKYIDFFFLWIKADLLDNTMPSTIRGKFKIVIKTCGFDCSEGQGRNQGDLMGIRDSCKEF